MGDWTNSDGLVVRFDKNIGNRAARAGVTTGSGKLRELVLEVDFTKYATTTTSYSADLNNDGTNDGFTTLNTPIPNGALISSVRVLTETALAGGTNYEVGTYTANGTVVDRDGIRTTAPADGAQIGTQATADWYVAVYFNGTYTAGKLKFVINYYVP